MSDFLVFEGISKSFGDLKVLDNVSFSVSKGEIFSLLGPSGCGKTTLLRIFAGFETPDKGRVILNGRDITNLTPNKRAVNTVFQNYSLFPNFTVRENIGFGLKMAKKPASYIKEEVDRFLDMIQMTDYADYKTTKLSGGQKQRVAIARALINRPQVLLLDEPLAALDLKLRQRMLVELDGIHDEVGITFLYVTHDQGEAMSLSDHLAVMNRGNVEQIGTPFEVYEAPRSSFVAAFIGDTNFFDGVVDSIKESEYSILKIEGFPDVLVFNDKKLKKGDLVHLTIRPEKISISAEKPVTKDFQNCVKGNIEEIIYLGPQTKYWVRVDDYRVSVHRQHNEFQLERALTWGDEVWLTWHADNCYMLERYQESDEALLTLPDEEEIEDIAVEESGE